MSNILPEKQVEKLVSDIFEKPSECAFDKDQKAVCSPRTVVNKMVEFVKAKKGEVPGEVIENPVKLISSMKEMMNCNSESCVIKHPEFIQFARISNVDKLLDEFFKPSGPATNFGLLNNFNIDEVLDQFEAKFPGFYHIPFQMRDFEKIGSELANVNLADKFKKNVNQFGVVLNTDYSHGRGIHWYCVMGEKLENKVVLEYFNSSGKEPLPETQAWLHKTKHFLTRELNYMVEVKYSTGISFQNDEHSCGVYCLMYIWLRLEGTPREWFKSDNFNDEFMHKARKVLFRHEV
jgi:hypothetical protein